MIRSSATKILAHSLLLVSLMLTVLLGLGVFNTPDAVAEIRKLEEAPGQIVYQSRETLTDQHGNSWQAIVFKRVSPNERTSIELRLVGFPGAIEIDRSKPLLLTNSMGESMTADDNSSIIFTDLSAPEPNVGEYDIHLLLPNLQPAIPLKLTLPVINGEAINLPVSASFVQDWKTLLSSGK